LSDLTKERTGLHISRRAGLHVFFLIRALEIAATGARIAFITPANWLDVDYGRAAKEYLVSHATIEGIITFDDGHSLFGRVRTSPSISLIQKSKGGGRPTRGILLEPGDLPPVEAIPSLLNKRLPGRVDGDRGKTTRPQLVRVRLGDVAKVQRGVATGMNRFFVISEEERARRHLEEADLRACLATPRLYRGTEITNEMIELLPPTAPRWLLSVHDAEVEKAKTPMGRYLRYGKRSLRAHKTYLTSHRRLWFAPESRANAPILFSYFNRPTGRFVRNRTGAVPLNNWLVIEPKDGIDPDLLFAALSHPAVLDQLRMNARRYGKGMWKLEPSELSQIELTSRVTLEGLRKARV
jgi:adenine-specific DNA-methyltransferase